MAITYATASSETNKQKGSAIYESKQTLSAPGTSDEVILPEEAGRFTSILAALVFSGVGEGYLQLTVSNRSDVLNGSANWFDWDAGSVITNTTDVLFHVSAIRMVNVSGTTIMELKWV